MMHLPILSRSSVIHLVGGGGGIFDSAGFIVGELVTSEEVLLLYRLVTGDG